MLKFKRETEFKETEIGEIPKDWEVKELKEIIEDSIVGCIPLKRNKKFWENGTIPWLTNKEVEYGTINYIYDTELKVTDIAIKETNLKLIPKNSLIISFTASVGKVAVNKIPITTNQQFISFILRNKHDVKYFAYYFVLQKEMIETFSGATPFSFITKENAVRIPVICPSPKEQTRISTILSWFDDLIENKKKQNEILEKTAMAIFKSWFVDFEPFKDGEFVDSELGKVPKGWEVGKLRTIAKIEGGGNAPQDEKYFIEGKFPFVRVKHLSKGVCVDGCDFINEKAIKDYRLKQFNEKSIVIQKSGESLKEARVNLLPFNSYVVNHLAIFDYKVNKSIIWFLFCYLKKILYDLIEGEGGTALPYLRMSDIQNFNILIPPQPILQKFHSLVEPLFQKIILNQKEIMVLRQVRDALLPLLVFGKLRVEEI